MEHDMNKTDLAFKMHKSLLLTFIDSDEKYYACNAKENEFW